jgi:ribonuclease HI
MANYAIHFDGSCWPNPGGVAAWGFTIDKDGTEISAVPGLVELDGQSSNNVAEFYALYMAYKALQKLSPEIGAGDTIEVRGDSQIVINIMQRKWRPNAEKLYWEAYRLAMLFHEMLQYKGVQIHYDWIPREENTRCDDLSKEINNAPK